MKIDCKKPLLALNGEQLTQGSGDQAEKLTLGMAIANVLLAPRQKPVENKIRVYLLSQKLYLAKGIVEIDAADDSCIRESCETDQSYGPLVTGQILSMLK